MITIDSRSSTPIYEQIINGIKENILKGIIEPGDKLPSVREMAVMLTTNPTTVSKAYGELERDRVIETLRGKGTYVSTDYKPRIMEDKMDKIKEEIKKIVLEAKYMGLSREDIVKLMDTFYDELEKQV